MKQKERWELRESVWKIMDWTPWTEEEYPFRKGWTLLNGEGEKRLECDMDEPTLDAAAAMKVLTYCMKNLSARTGRGDWQIVVLYDHGNDEPFCVTTDSVHDADDMAHVKNCAAAKTMELAICLFATRLFKK